MEKVYLKLLKDWKDHKSGDVIQVTPGLLPMRMVENGTAKYYYKGKVVKKKKTEDGGTLGISVNETIYSADRTGK